jgi:transcriptional regulator of acetoin/glycerol metabolism
MRVPRANVLLRGTDGVVQNVVDMLLPTLRAPIETWQPGERLVLPSAPQPGTMILRDIGRLTPDEQCRLLTWMDLSVGRTQIVSTTFWPLFSRVQSGAFIDTLYYRLNTVYVNLSS